MELGTDLDAECDQRVDDPLVDGHEQKKGYHESIVEETGQEDPTVSAKRCGDKILMADPKDHIEQEEHKLETKLFDDERGGRKTDGNTALAEVVDLHGLTSAGTGGDAAVVGPFDGYEDRVGNTDTAALVVEIDPNTKRIEKDVKKITETTHRDPFRCAFAESIQHIVHIDAIETDQKNDAQGAEDQYEIKDFLSPRLHNPSGKIN